MSPEIRLQPRQPRDGVRQELLERRDARLRRLRERRRGWSSDRAAPARRSRPVSSAGLSWRAAGRSSSISGLVVCAKRSTRSIVCLRGDLERRERPDRVGQRRVLRRGRREHGVGVLDEALELSRRAAQRREHLAAVSQQRARRGAVAVEHAPAPSRRWWRTDTARAIAWLKSWPRLVRAIPYCCCQTWNAFRVAGSNVDRIWSRLTASDTWPCGRVPPSGKRRDRIGARRELDVGLTRAATWPAGSRACPPVSARIWDRSG